MTRRLILMRHAKSSWTSGAKDDHARPLNKRGRRDAPRIAAALFARDWWPDVVLSSDAERTLETWALMAPGGPEVRLSSCRSLYHGGIDEIKAAMADQAAAQTVLVLGHNPGWAAALTWLSDGDGLLTTANAALFTTAAASWQEAFAGPGRLHRVGVLRPKSLPDLQA